MPLDQLASFHERLPFIVFWAEGRCDHLPGFSGTARILSGSASRA
ncbi:hypothetical protein THTE_1460 [Thermogutta terrifontis]|uniref:Uncharacterized protein n=1 Tax=Thermogutta terrifontis TaxID=1331910 RepID=A0A286RDP3_9BACT|nr:hypothetical protein THTE_1460 [Thermogutta terrifontis]